MLLMLLMRWCCWCCRWADATDALLLLMHCCCEMGRCTDALMLLICCCCCCWADAVDTLMLLMHLCCWCADAADVLMLLMRLCADELILLMRCWCWLLLLRWCCWCTDAANTLMLLMRWCCWRSDAADVLMLLMTTAYVLMTRVSHSCTTSSLSKLTTFNLVFQLLHSALWHWTEWESRGTTDPGIEFLTLIIFSTILNSWRGNSSFRLCGLGPLCLWQCFQIWFVFVFQICMFWFPKFLWIRFVFHFNTQNITRLVGILLPISGTTCTSWKYSPHLLELRKPTQ